MFGGYTGVIGAAFARSGCTSASHGPVNGLPSTRSVSKLGSKHSQGGREWSLFRRRLKVCMLASDDSTGGMDETCRPVESAMSTRNEVRLERKAGSARSGFAATLSSSRLTHAASGGGRATRKLAEISNARRVLLMFGSVCVRNAGSEFGVSDDASKRCVVPASADQ